MKIQNHRILRTGLAVALVAASPGLDAYAAFSSPGRGNSRAVAPVAFSVPISPSVQQFVGLAASQIPSLSPYPGSFLPTLQSQIPVYDLSLRARAAEVTGAHDESTPSKLNALIKAAGSNQQAREALRAELGSLREKISSEKPSEQTAQIKTALDELFTGASSSIIGTDGNPVTSAEPGIVAAAPRTLRKGGRKFKYQGKLYIELPHKLRSAPILESDQRAQATVSAVIAKPGAARWKGPVALSAAATLAGFVFFRAATNLTRKEYYRWLDHPLSLWESINLGWVNDFLTVPGAACIAYLVSLGFRAVLGPRVSQAAAVWSVHYVAAIAVGNSIVAEIHTFFQPQLGTFDAMDLVMFSSSWALASFLAPRLWWPRTASDALQSDGPHGEDFSMAMGVVTLFVIALIIASLFPFRALWGLSFVSPPVPVAAFPILLASFLAVMLAFHRRWTP